MTFYWTFSTVGGALLSGRFNCWPVEPGSIRITCGSKVVTDDGDGFFIGDGSGPVDYDYGFFDLEFDPPSPPSGTPVVAAYEPVEGGCVDDCNKCKTHKLRLDITPGSIAGQDQISISDAWTRLFTKINRDVKPIHVEFITEDFVENYQLSIGSKFDVIPADEEPLDTGGIHVLLDDTSW